MNPSVGPADPQCCCEPCARPAAKGGRCQSTDTMFGTVRSSHCTVCVNYCLADA